MSKASSPSTPTQPPAGLPAAAATAASTPLQQQQQEEHKADDSASSLSHLATTTELHSSPSKDAPQTPAPFSSASDNQQLPAYLLASPSGSAQLSASHYTPLNSSGFPTLGLRHPLDGPALPPTPLPGSTQEAAGAANATAQQPSLAPLVEEGAQYPSPAGTLVPPRGAEQRWSLGPVPTKAAPVGVHADKEEAVQSTEASGTRESLIESRRVSTLSTASSRASGVGSRSSQGAPPTRPPSLPPSDTTAGIIASRPSSRRGSALPDASPSGAMSPQALRPISTLSLGASSSAGSQRGSRSLSAVSPGGPGRLPSPLNAAGQRGSLLNPSQDGATSANKDASSAAAAAAAAPESAEASVAAAGESSARSSLAATSNSRPFSTATTASGFTAIGDASGSSLGGGAAPARRASIDLPPVKIRDFGFPDSDPRHLGARDVSASAASGQGDEDEATSAATAARKRLWGGPAAAAEEDEEGRTTEEWDVPPSDDDEDDSLIEEDDDAAAQTGLPEGLYEAAYAFEAESEHELSVASGEKLRVVGALEGGWAIAERLEVKGDAKECERGLVPEAYLEWIGD